MAIVYVGSGITGILISTNFILCQVEPSLIVDARSSASMGSAVWLFVALVLIFYVAPLTDCSPCQHFKSIPFTLLRTLGSPSRKTQRAARYTEEEHLEIPHNHPAWQQYGDFKCTVCRFKLCNRLYYLLLLCNMLYYLLLLCNKLYYKIAAI